MTNAGQTQSTPISFLRRGLHAFALLLAVSASAGASPARAAEPEITYHPGARIYRYIGTTGFTEFRVEHEERRFLVPNTWNAVLFGRDLDGDGLPDAWFYRDEHGLLEYADRPAHDRDGWDVASELLASQVAVEDRFYVGLGLNQVFDALTFTGSYIHGTEASMLQQEIDLDSLQILTLRLMETQPDNANIPILNSMIHRGLNQMIDAVESTYIRNSFLAAGADVGLFYLGSAVIRGARVVEGFLVRRLLGIEAVELVAEAYTRYVTALKGSAGRWAARVAERAGLRFGPRTAEELLAEAEAHALLRMTAGEQVQVSIRALISRSRISALASRAFATVGNVARAGVASWRYTLLTQSLQIGAEVLSRGRELWDPNPFVMAKKFASNREFLQDFAFMTNETFWMAGISSYFPGMGRKMIACGLFSLVDSTLMNYAIKHTTDPVRSGFDTGWEVTIGNAQTQLDMVSLRLFESMATRNGNPRLRLLGYAVAMVDQGIGYYAYGEASQAVTDHEGKIKTKVIPVMGELADAPPN